MPPQCTNIVQGFCQRSIYWDGKKKRGSGGANLVEKKWKTLEKKVFIIATIYKLCRKFSGGCLPMIAHHQHMLIFFSISFFSLALYFTFYDSDRYKSDRLWVGAGTDSELHCWVSWTPYPMLSHICTLEKIKQNYNLTSHSVMVMRESLQVCGCTRALATPLWCCPYHLGWLINWLGNLQFFNFLPRLTFGTNFEIRLLANSALQCLLQQQWQFNTIAACKWTAVIQWFQSRIQLFEHCITDSLSLRFNHTTMIVIAIV